MKRFCLFLLAIGTGFARPAPAQQATPPPASSTPSPGKAPQSLRGKLIYKPVGPGVPLGRVDAGSRGDGDEVASLYVIAPESIGFSSHAQPSIYWFQTAPAPLPFEISILKPNEPAPVLRVREPSATTGGFHHLNLAEHGIQLAPGVDYQWVVALVRDPQSRSRDIVSSGWIRYTPGRDKEDRKADPASLASAGYWYDTVSALFSEIKTRPNDPQLAADRRDLFAQVGLPPLPELPATKRR